jgi:hypothetical protein
MVVLTGGTIAPEHLAMPIRYRAREHDCISRIAFRFGYLPETIWNADENAELRSSRTDPNTLAPGDEIVLPGKRSKAVSISVDARHVFRRRGAPERLRVQLLLEGKPRAGHDYMLEVDGSIVQEGQTDPDGWVVAPISPDARAARILLRRGIEALELQLGVLRPLVEDDPRSIQQRLASLDYYHCESNGHGSELELALSRYQSDRGLRTTGRLDAETKFQILSESGG